VYFGIKVKSDVKSRERRGCAAGLYNEISDHVKIRDPALFVKFQELP
jgi:hypothetical protein